MALFNEILEGGINNSLAKRFGMQTGAPAPSLTPEIFPVVQVGVAWEELSFNQGWRRWQGVQSQAAVAGQAARFQVVNRGTGTLIVVEEVIFTPASSLGAGSSLLVHADFGYGLSAALATLAPQSNEFRDTRQTPSAGSSLERSAGTDAAVLTATAGTAIISGGQSTVFPGAPWLLWGTGGMLWGLDVNNLAMNMTVVWSERGMSRGELLG